MGLLFLAAVAFITVVAAFAPLNFPADAASVDPWWIVVAFPLMTGLAVGGWYRYFSLQRVGAINDSS